MTDLFLEPDLRDLLRAKPELFAIADALTNTQRADDWPVLTDRKQRLRSDWRRGRRGYLVGLLVRRRFSSRQRFVLVVVLVGIGLAIPLIAVATNAWWFQRSQGPVPKPVSGQPSTIATGRWQGRQWTALAYIAAAQHIPIKIGNRVRPDTQHAGICTFVIVGKLSNWPSAGSCGPLRGIPGRLKGAPAHGWLTVFVPNTPTLVLGAAAKGVARVELVLESVDSDKKTTITTALKSAPGIGGGVRFFVLSYPTDGRVVTQVIALDASGRILGRFTT